MPRQSTLAVGALAVASFLFGATFVVVKDAVEVLPPLGFVGWRFLVGAAVLLAIARPRRLATVRAGTIAGLWLFAGYAFQTTGLVTTSASNSGLITGLYVVLTPFAATALRRSRPRPLVVAGAVLAFAGLALLTLGDGFRLHSGDLWTMACAVAYTGHIVYLSRVANRHPAIALTGVQLAVTAILGLTGSSLFEDFAVPGNDTMAAVVGTGLAVSAAAFLLQVWSQSILGPTRTALILALEPAFAALVGVLVAGDRLGWRGAAGATFILAGIYVVLADTGAEDQLDPTLPAEAVSPAH